ncbi:MAG TPA: DUF3108 domain-containing protein [Candidatus Acidoferrum sp.]|nr:DUF3108 domain-containing protein [Candidatus Acidoferrum sp.]
MSAKKSVAIVAVALVGFGVGVIYYLHARGSQPAPAVVSAEPKEFHAAPPPEKLETSATKKESAPEAKAEEKKAAPSTPTIVPPVDTGLPLKAGEVLEFTANVAKLSNVATLSVKVVGRGNFAGKSAWHLQASAHTQNPLRMVFELDDQFDSYSDAGTLASMQYEMRLSERGQKVESLQRMTASDKEPAPADASAARVLPGTRDPLGMLEYLRNVDWSKTPEVRSPVYDGHKLYDVRAKLAGSEAVEVASGKYAASKIGIRVLEDGVEMKDASFTLYLSNDAARTPVLLEAVLPFATARVELVKTR